MARIARAIGPALSPALSPALGPALGATPGPPLGLRPGPLWAAEAPQGLFELARRHGAPTSLAAIGMPADGLDRAADLAVHNQYPNPRPLDRAALRALLQRAFDGEPPRS
jgi:hypothetical protein